MNQYLFTFICLISLAACTQKTSVADISFESVIGFMHGHCLAIKAVLNEGSKIHIIELESSKRYTGVVEKPVTTGQDCFMLLDDRKSMNRAHEYRFYKVALEREIDFAMGVLASVDHDTRTQQLHYQYCFTSEGVKFHAQDKNQIVWQGYYYLGYDVTPTC